MGRPLRRQGRWYSTRVQGDDSWPGRKGTGYFSVVWKSCPSPFVPDSGKVSSLLSSTGWLSPRPSPFAQGYGGQAAPPSGTDHVAHKAFLPRGGRLGRPPWVSLRDLTGPPGRTRLLILPRKDIICAISVTCVIRVIRGPVFGRRGGCVRVVGRDRRVGVVG